VSRENLRIGRLTAPLAVGGAALAAGLWWRKHPSPCPYALRIWVQVPHPVISRSRLKRLLEPQPSERILEIGPGTGYYTLALAEWLGSGQLEILDIQPEMLDHTMRKVRARGLTNVVSRQADATGLPHADGSFDAVLLVTVFGEIPDGDAALREVHRVLRPGGRLIVGEIALGDPHFSRFGSLRNRAEDAGLVADGRSGYPLAYFARFTKPV
jgi:SAM-dependent methyltransferase